MLRIKETEVKYIQYVLPEFANPLGNLYGGRMMNWIVTAGTLASLKISKGFALLASLDSVYFLQPVKVGDYVEARAFVCYVGKTSMEISVFVDFGDFKQKKKEKAIESHMSFVAVDEQAKPKGIEEKVYYADEEEKILYEEAFKRRISRIEKIKDRNIKKFDTSSLGNLRYKLSSARVVMPEDAIQGNFLFAGKLLMMVDEIAGILASKYSNAIVVTGSLEEMHFYNPAKVGEILEIEAGISAAWNTSLEIIVKVIAWNPLTNIRKHCSTATTVFIALDEQGRPKKIPVYEPKTEDEQRLFEEANKRREKRLKILREMKFKEFQ